MEHPADVPATLVRHGRTFATVSVQATAGYLPALIGHAGGNYALDPDADGVVYRYWPLGTEGPESDPAADRPPAARPRDRRNR